MPHGHQPEESYRSPILNQQMCVLLSQQLIFLDTAEYEQCVYVVPSMIDIVSGYELTLTNPPLTYF